MSKTKHPANKVVLTESEHFVHISALLYIQRRPKLYVWIKMNKIPLLTTNKECKTNLPVFTITS